MSGEKRAVNSGKDVATSRDHSTNWGKDMKEKRYERTYRPGRKQYPGIRERTGGSPSWMARLVTVNEK